MIGWLEASWVNVAVLIAGVITACVIIRTVIETLPLQAPPAGGWDTRELIGPPEWEPDDAEAHRIAEQFAEAAAEQDDWHD